MTYDFVNPPLTSQVALDLQYQLASFKLRTAEQGELHQLSKAGIQYIPTTKRHPLPHYNPSSFANWSQHHVPE